MANEFELNDVYEPLELYRSKFKDLFAEKAKAKFEELATASQVDQEANIALCTEIRTLEKKLASANSKKGRLGVLNFFLWILVLAGIGGGIFAFASEEKLSSALRMGLMIGAGALALVLLWVIFAPLRKARAKASQLVDALQSEVTEKKNQAWAQMAPLNKLYSWNVVTELIEATVPKLHFDPYFCEGRLSELQTSFGWDGSYNDDKSVVASLSGVIEGNPFVFGQLLRQTWGTKIYKGYLTIHWTTTERDDKGRTRRVQHSETLVAEVEKPIPVYSEERVLIYGNDAAPALSFTRMPSELSNAEAGFWTNWKKKSKIKELEKFSRNLDDDSNYTMMGNKEFEALFCTKDRDNEVEFRLLFTPLAQIQMLALLKDTKDGYGDDFAFLKNKKINVIMPRHLSDIDMTLNPNQFRSFDIEAAKANFLSRCEQYFKAYYFAFAPLFVVPLYQQVKSHETIYGDILDKRSTFWEYEAAANFFGDSRFKHPQSVTQNILKARSIGREDDVARVEVTAHGYRGEKRREVKSVLGGDGHFHDVPVDWIEYLPVERTSEFFSAEQTFDKESSATRTLSGKQECQQKLEQMLRDSSGGTLNRRNLISFFINK